MNLSLPTPGPPPSSRACQDLVGRTPVPGAPPQAPVSALELAGAVRPLGPADRLGVRPDPRRGRDCAEHHGALFLFSWSSQVFLAPRPPERRRSSPGSQCTTPLSSPGRPPQPLRGGACFPLPGDGAPPKGESSEGSAEPPSRPGERVGGCTFPRSRPDRSPEGGDSFFFFFQATW